MADPHRFFPSFAVHLADEDVERFGLDDMTAVAVYVTVRAAGAIEGFVANLKAPILVWSGHGHQVINQVPGCELRAPLFAPPSAEAAAGAA